jgi:NAD+ synthase (glutamine-hydrolysing)
MIRERMFAVRAADSVACVAFCNLVGGQDELVFDGGSAIFGPDGQLLARGKQFAEDLIIQDIDIDDITRRRLVDTRRRKEKQHAEVHDTRVTEVIVPVQFQAQEGRKTCSIAEPLSELAEIYEALVLGTRDYLRKNGFETAVIGLSGGIDSALVACIASDAIGQDNVTAVFMPSRYSSQHSGVDAAQLAQALNLRFLTIPIEPAVETYSLLLADVFSGKPHDLTEENLQSRIRGTILMALSNKFGSLVLTTGNKSEMSTGYATLYGDMAGGFAVIKDVPKTLVYGLCRYRNSRKAVIPENVFIKPPSAELRFDQKDSDSLPEYRELDPILRAYVEEDRGFAEMMAGGFDAATVSRVAMLVDRSEYKRRQAPPGVKITPRAFGKDRRLPITNRFTEEGA